MEQANILLVWYNPCESQRLQLCLQFFIMYSDLMWQSPRAAQYLQNACLSVHGVGIADKINKRKQALDNN